jgi:hypothetical protein
LTHFDFCELGRCNTFLKRAVSFEMSYVSPVVPEPARAMARHLRSLNIRTTTNVMFLSIHDSKSDKESGTESWCNPDHVEVAMKYIIGLIQNNDFKGKTGQQQ